MAVLLDGTIDRSAAVSTTGMSEDLFDILVCPVDKSDLRLEQASLACVSCGRVYAVNDGIPDMLVEDETEA